MNVMMGFVVYLRSRWASISFLTTFTRTTLKKDKQTHRHTHTQTHTQTHIHMHIHMHKLKLNRGFAQTHVPIYISTQIHFTHSRTLLWRHTHTHAHTHTHTHTHTQTYAQPLILAHTWTPKHIC